MLSTTTPDNCKKTLYDDLLSLLSSTCVIRVVLSVSYLLVSYFVMNFLRRIFSVCHSFRSMCQSGRMKGFERCFKGEDQGTWCRQNLHAAMGGFHVTSSPPCWWTVNKRLLISSFCLSTSICSFHHCYLCLPRLHENHLFCDRLRRGYKLSFMSSIWGKEKLVMGNVEPLLGIAKPAEGLNKPCQVNVNGRKSFAAEGFNVKIPFVSQTYTKAVAISSRQSHIRTRNLVKYHPRVVFTESFHAMVSTDEEVCSPCEREFDRHCKVQEKRHRDREPSRLPIKKIMSSMKKRKARRKLKRIFRKSTPKPSSLYKSIATYYKLWYVTYVHRCDCFFTNFANLKRWAANKLLQNSKQASMQCLVEHKTVKSCNCTKRNEAFDVR